MGIHPSFGIGFYYAGTMRPRTPHLVFFLFVAMQRERRLDKKEKHAGRFITAKLNLKRVNSLYDIFELVTKSNLFYRSNSTRSVVVSLSSNC